jgi:hypothetical protein
VAIVSVYVDWVRARRRDDTMEGVSGSVIMSTSLSYLVIVLHARCDDGVNCKLTLLVKRRRGHCRDSDAKG